MASLQLLGVTKVFATGVQAVQAVDLEVQDGEVLALFGPSGSGKTTLLRVIAGLEPATNGRVMIGGADVTRTPPHLRNVALVFQDSSLYGHWTIAQNLAFAAGGRGWGASNQVAQQVQEIAEQTGITDWLSRWPAQLSGGQQQRVALARALIRQPSALLLDEPLANLDAPVRQELVGELRLQVKRRQLTAIYVTHDLAEALSLADRVGVLIEGQLRQIGSPAEVFALPADEQIEKLFAPLRRTERPGWWWLEGK